MTGSLAKKGLTEQDICTKFITPALVAAGWDLHAQIREQLYFTAGRVNVRGKLVSRGKGKRADYILFYKPNLPIAVIEAKDLQVGVGHGMQQALDYAETLDVPFAFSSNGEGFLEHDRTGDGAVVERQLTLAEFPTPDALWARYCASRGISPAAEPIVTQDYHSESAGKPPRYYQIAAINRTVEAIARGQDRILLVLATGTGKTFTAFQIIWRLWKSKARQRILFLADRNILVDQTRTNDFKPFGKAMTKISNRKVDKSYEVYLALYQAIAGNEDARDIFKQFSPDFFDLIVVDECHRGSAAEDSAWREILTYFGSATQIGLTATPRETTTVSTTDYFGEPVYTYSLKQGIEDGFLAPYKVVRIDIDKDLEGWRPTAGKVDVAGRVIEDRVYNQSDFDRNLVLLQRSELVAAKVTEFLKANDRFAKTIVFCEDIEHAERMRSELVSLNPDLCARDRRYVMRITGDSPEGKAELDNFIHPEQRFPVVVTTSKLMTTGVDAQTCKVVVLDQNIRSMSEFKQIIGRGTRIREDFGKLYFTIIDFRKATEMFADPGFDGLPLQVLVGPDGDTEVEADEGHGAATQEDGPSATARDGEGNDGGGADGDGDGTGGRRVKYVVGDVPVSVLKERVMYYGRDGRLVTESLRDYAKTAVQEQYSSLDAFLRRWNEADRKQAIVRELDEQGLLLDAVADEVGRDYSAFDLVCHVAFGQPPLTRRERAANVRKRDYFTRYGEAARAVLDVLLTKYADEGIDDIEDINVLKVKPLTVLGTPVEIIQRFGGRDAYLAAVRALEDELYRAS
ncbi:MAG: DEAD/DEAH box helicase family protein [Deltaproteobacteria bacterium]|nr:DEAD/DEAH box helicase family protein [Myxococcales bacterium]MDP3212929.1 DEAD/DEAH box helicase family protein [Deltaproteobacteria bacterium]